MEKNTAGARLISQRAKREPGPAVWAHQARQMSGQALEVTVEAYKLACSSHLVHPALSSRSCHVSYDT
jgi:hypothetical protein